jgi:hypothetical protein
VCRVEVAARARRVSSGSAGARGAGAGSCGESAHGGGGQAYMKPLAKASRSPSGAWIGASRDVRRSITCGGAEHIRVGGERERERERQKERERERERESERESVRAETFSLTSEVYQNPRSLPQPVTILHTSGSKRPPSRSAYPRRAAVSAGARGSRHSFDINLSVFRHQSILLSTSIYLSFHINLSFFPHQSLFKVGGAQGRTRQASRRWCLIHQMSTACAAGAGRGQDVGWDKAVSWDKAGGCGEQRARGLRGGRGRPARRSRRA